MVETITNNNALDHSPRFKPWAMIWKPRAKTVLTVYNIRKLKRNFANADTSTSSVAKRTLKCATQRSR
jgi:hypothetical protein